MEQKAPEGPIALNLFIPHLKLDTCSHLGSCELGTGVEEFLEGYQTFWFHLFGYQILSQYCTIANGLSNFLNVLQTLMKITYGTTKVTSVTALHIFTFKRFEKLQAIALLLL